MGSMSYCLFENTAAELERCLRVIEDHATIKKLIESRSSEYEGYSVEELIELCRTIVALVDSLERT